MGMLRVGRRARDAGMLLWWVYIYDVRSLGKIYCVSIRVVLSGIDHSTARQWQRRLGLQRPKG